MLLHDLSAPVRHIQHFVERLTESLPDPTPDQTAWIRRIEENIDTGRSLLRDSRLLLASERNPVARWERPRHVNATLKEVVASFRPDCEEKDLLLKVDLCDDTKLAVDPQAIGRVVANLLGNAVSATRPGGTITVSSRREGGTTCFRVSDTGRGFTRDEAATLSRGWKGFDRGASPPNLWGGLGLLICYRILLRYGGQLSVTSEGPGEGSTFAFRIPVAPDPLAAVPQDPASSPWASPS